MAGQNAVLVAFGPRSLKKDDVQEVLMRNLIAAMTKHAVKRVVNLSAWGSGGGMVPPRDFMVTNLCPGHLKNSPARGGVRASLYGKGLERVMHREDLAAFMVEQLSSQKKG